MFESSLHATAKFWSNDKAVGHVKIVFNGKGARGPACVLNCGRLAVGLAVAQSVSYVRFCLFFLFFLLDLSLISARSVSQNARCYVYLHNTTGAALRTLRAELTCLFYPPRRRRPSRHRHRPRPRVRSTRPPLPVRCARIKHGAFPLPNSTHGRTDGRPEREQPVRPDAAHAVRAAAGPAHPVQPAIGPVPSVVV